MSTHGLSDYGLAWYTPATWRELTALPEAKINISYRQFVRNYERLAADLARDGVSPVRIPIDVRQLVAWCHLHGLEIDSRGRAKFGAALLLAQADGRDVMTVPFEDRTRGPLQ